MKIRRRPSPLLLLLIPSLCSSIAISQADKADSAVNPREAARDPTLESAPAPLPSPLTATLKPDLGTKEAPVDGQDGKPHAGPFVETAADRDKKKAKADGEEEVPGKKPAPKPLKEPIKDVSFDKDGKRIPESNDGVMDDRNRASPKQGTIGTEGGVSEKDRDRKAQEGQTGEKLEKKPDPPKEAPPLPQSEQEKIALDSSKKPVKDNKEKDKGTSPLETEKPKGAAGLEVTSSPL